MADAGVIEQLLGNKRFSVFFDEERAKRHDDTEFCAILGKIEEVLRNKGSAFDFAAKVQVTTIPHIFEGHNVMARAQTGAGKTLAFAIGMLAKVNRSNNNIQAVCFAPTQELVIQTKNIIAALVEGIVPEIRVVDTLTTSSDTWKAMTRDTLPHIVVSTDKGLSSRLKSMTAFTSETKWAKGIKGSLLGSVKLLVLDEADDMIMESSNLTKITLPLMKKEYGLNFEQVVCYSATYNDDSINQITAICKRADGRKLKFSHIPYAISPAIKQIIVNIKSEKDRMVTLQRKLFALQDIYRNNVVNKSIIFVNRKSDIDIISEKIESLSNRAAGLDYVCGKFYSKMQDPNNPSENTEAINKYRKEVFANFCKPKGQEGAFDVIITTDVMARGIDLPEINLVFNFDLPLNTDSVDPIKYIHRIGRCSRFGKIGTAVTFVEEETTGFEEIKAYCTYELIKDEVCDFKYDEICGEEKIGERVSALINELKTRKADVLEEEAKLDFVVRDDDESLDATASVKVETNSTVFDDTVGNLSKISIGGGSL